MWLTQTDSCLQVKFVMSEETQLADLLVLNLHNFEDEVGTLLSFSILTLTALTM